MKLLLRKMIVRFLLLSTIFLFIGCFIFADIAFPPHPNSLKDSPDIVCTKLIMTQGMESTMAAMALAGSEFLVSQVVKGIEKESKRYSSTYSARDQGYLFRISKSKKNGEIKVKKKFGSLEVSRLYGEAVRSLGCKPPLKGKPAQIKAMSFFAKIEFSDFDRAIKIVPHKFNFNNSKGKVDSGPYWYLPWSWWKVFSSSEGDVDVNIQVELKIIGAKTISTAAIDFPIGKINIKDKVELLSEKLKHLESDWIPMPDIKMPQLQNIDIDKEYGFIPFDMKVTIIEANEMGNVLAKGGSKLEENQEKILRLLK